jgi:hypothetical protein
LNPEPGTNQFRPLVIILANNLALCLCAFVAIFPIYPASELSIKVMVLATIRLFFAKTPSMKS